MSTYTQILYQIIFGTKNRERTLSEDNREELFKYISGIIENKKCHLYQINGVEDHIHILTHLHPSIALADLVKDIKLASTKFKRKVCFVISKDGRMDTELLHTLWIARQSLSTM